MASKTLSSFQKKDIANLLTVYDPEVILAEARKKLNEPNEGEDGEYETEQFSDKSTTFKALTLSEFSNGILLIQTLPERYSTLAIDLLRKLQQEYNCVTTSEKMMAENVVINFLRTIETKQRMNDYLERGTVTDRGVGYLKMLSKELDRANRHYLTSMHSLSMLKLPPVKVNINMNNTVIGQKQVIHGNQNVKSI